MHVTTWTTASSATTYRTFYGRGWHLARTARGWDYFAAFPGASLTGSHPNLRKAVARVREHMSDA